MSQRRKLAVFRIVAGMALIGLSAGPCAAAQEKAAAETGQTVPLSNKKTPGPSKTTTDKTTADPEDFKSDAPGPVGVGDRHKPTGNEDSSRKPEKNAYDYELPGSDGKGIPLKSFKGKTILIVNLARNSSYNTQLAGLQKVSDLYKDSGVVVIGVPSNEFGAAEPGTEAEVQKSYKVEGKVTFLVTAKSTLTGDAALPLFVYLTKGKTVPEGGPVHWNYTKFIVDKTGKVVARFSSDVAPDSTELLSSLDQILEGTFKPRKVGAPPPGGADEDGPEPPG